MACERNAQRSLGAALGCGIAQTTHKAGLLAGQVRQKLEANLDRDFSAIRNYYLLGQLGVAGAVAAIYAQQSRQTQAITLTDKGRNITFTKAQKAPLQLSTQDKAIMNQIQAAIDMVETQVGKTDIRNITLGDDFGFSRSVAEIGHREQQAKASRARGLRRLRKKAACAYYQLLKPILVGRLFIGSKLGRSPLAVAGQETGELAFNQKYLTQQHRDLAGNTLDYGRYVAIHEALHQVQRTPTATSRFGQRLLARHKEEALVDAIAARLVDPAYQGRRSGYHTIRRLADWRARLVAQRTGEQPLEVLIRQLKAHPQPLRGT